MLESYVYLAYIFETVQKVIVSQNLDQELLLIYFPFSNKGLYSESVLIPW